MSKRKLRGEGTPSEEKIVLVWKINSKTFRVYSPIEKYKIWDTSLLWLLTVKKINSKILESTVSRLNHVGHILIQGRYFLNRMRRLQSRCDKYGLQKLLLKVKEDIDL